ncbi:hypothetical protein Tco_0588854 [Tanacetum coccineum]
MANIRSCNKHNMIACVEKTAQNADFYQIIDFLTGCSINYSLLVDPDLIGPWLQQFWATATLQKIENLKTAKDERRKKEKEESASVQIGGKNKGEGTLSPRAQESVNIRRKKHLHVKIEKQKNGFETTQSTARQEQHNAAEVLVAISRPRGLSIPGPIQTQPQQPTQGTDTQGTDPKDKGKGILVARKIQAEWMQKKKERGLKMKKQSQRLSLTLRNLLLFSCSRKKSNDEFPKEKEREMLKERDAQRLSRKRKATITEEQPSKKPKLRSETIDELRNYLRVVDFEKNAQDKESLEGISMITALQNQEDWEIVRWRLNESSGVHTLELEDGTMIHMLTERRYPLSRELMIRMLDHGMEVEDESDIAITLIHLFILWTTEDGDDS